MALHVPRAPGFYSMLKDGARHYSGLEEAVYRNIEACTELANTTKTSYGPLGHNKIIINHIEKLFVTNDAATILQELEVAHPAAKMLVLASKQQEQEGGDGSNLALILAGALLAQAESVLRMGLSPTEIISGYERASIKGQTLLNDYGVGKVQNLRNENEVEPVIKCALMSKQFGLHDALAKLVTKACISVLPSSNHFDVDKVRVCKIIGGGVEQSRLVSGMVFRRQAEGDVSQVCNTQGGDSRVKIAVFSCPMDFLQTETKGTILMETAEELANFSSGEEAIAQAQAQALSEAGIQVVVSGGKVGELALHYLNHFKIMVVRVSSKFDLRRLCQATGATALPRITTPTGEEVGSCSRVFTEEVGETTVVVFQEDDCPITTILLRASTDNLLDDLERTVDDGVNTFKALSKNPNYVPGGGATESFLATKLAAWGEEESGLEQYAIQKFSAALDDVVKALAENCGLHGAETVSKIRAEHSKNNFHTGIFCDPATGLAQVCNVYQPHGLVDLTHIKQWALRMATRAACTVLRVDEIIMSRPAGGPKPGAQGGADPDD